VTDKILTLNGFEAEMHVLSTNQGKILNPSTSCPEVFHGFPQFFLANIGTVHQIRLCLLPSKCFPIHYSPVIQHYIV
jgi:hypothetical protein